VIEVMAQPVRTVTVAAESFGVSIAVQCDPKYASAVLSNFPAGARPIEPSTAKNKFVFERRERKPEVFCSGPALGTKRTAVLPLAPALTALQKEIHVCVAEHARDYAFVHAAVVVWKNLAMIFPGKSFAGKSTLAWRLVQAGAVYYSDEYAVFDSAGNVYPFALPINLRREGGLRTPVVPDRVGCDAVKPGVLIFVRYRRGATWRPTVLEPAEALVQLIRQAITVRSHPSFVVSVLKKVSLQVKSFSGYRDDSDQIRDWLDLMSQKLS
jgi:hypothetical protein